MRGREGYSRCQGLAYTSYWKLAEVTLRLQWRLVEVTLRLHLGYTQVTLRLHSGYTILYRTSSVAARDVTGERPSIRVGRK